MKDTAQMNYRERLFYRSCLESAPRPVPAPPKLSARQHTPGNRQQWQLDQLKRKLLRAALEESAAEVGLYKRICGVANQAAELAWNQNCPLLILPCLFEELLQVARKQFQQEREPATSEAPLMNVPIIT
jgi:hypothetical protein